MSDENQQVQATPLRKISVKTVHGKIKQAEIPTDKSVRPLMQLIGTATGVVKGEGDYGPWTKLIGQFEAIDLDSGEVFTAPECFLPEPYHSMIAQRLEGSEKVPPATALDFAFEVGVKAPGEDSTVKYEYSTKVLVDASQGDPLAHLRSRAPRFAALAPPAAVPAVEDQSGKGKGKGK